MSETSNIDKLFKKLTISKPKKNYSTINKNGSSFTSIEDITEHLMLESTKNVVVVVGAGISTLSGIPDFRTPGTGLYDNLQKYDIPYPEAIFDLRYFKKNSKPFFTLAKELYNHNKYKPSLAHQFMKQLHDRQKLFYVFTQNIDGLERAVGIPDDKLVEAHGTLNSATCIKCREKYSESHIKDEIMQGEIPKCRNKKCKGIIKPDIVFFGEQLPEKFWMYEIVIPTADLIIVMGTSLEVEPFASIIDYANPKTPRLLINKDIVGSFKHGRENDVLVIGDIKEKLQSLISLLNWNN